MPTINQDNRSRYRTAKDLRNNPRDEMERELRTLDANTVIEKLLDKYPNERDWHRELAAAMARKVLGYDTNQPREPRLEQREFGSSLL